MDLGLAGKMASCSGPLPAPVARQRAELWSQYFRSMVLSVM
jgi:hypothetical protein